jgi:hypothetical protein
MSIDAFLAELFSPSGGGAVNPATFDDRFGGGAASPLETQDVGMRLSGAPADTAPQFPGGVVPLPRERPDEAGPRAGDLNMERPAPMGPQGGAAPPDAGGLFSRLAGLTGGGMTAPANTASRDEGAKGLLSRLAGMDASGEKRLRSTLAGGFAGGNPAFAGGAFMKGASGGLTGGLKSDKEDSDAETTAADTKQKQSNFDRTQGDKEMTSAALRKLYGVRGDTMARDAQTRSERPASTAKTAWNKPAHERFKDAERLILDKEKTLKNALNPLAPKAERESAAAAAKQEMADYRKRVYKQYGFDENGNDTGAAPQSGGGGTVPSTDRVVGDQEGKATGLYPKGTYDDPAAPESQEEFDALPAGTVFKNPADGRMMTKRGAAPE